MWPTNEKTSTVNNKKKYSNGAVISWTNRFFYKIYYRLCKYCPTANQSPKEGCGVQNKKLNDTKCEKKPEKVLKKLIKSSLNHTRSSKLIETGGNVRKAAQVEGPNTSSTSSDNMKLWRFVEDNNDEFASSESD